VQFVAIRCYHAPMRLRVLSFAAALLMTAACLGQDPAVHRASLDLSRGIPLVRVLIDGRGPFQFVVDTGTSCEAIVSPRLMERLHLAPTGTTRITDLGGRSTHSLDEVELDSVQLAGEEFRPVRAVVTDLPDGDAVFDGILGFRLFRDQLLTLDFRRHKLLLSEGRLAGSRNSDVLPMRMRGGIPEVELTAGGAPFEAAIDSGGIDLSLTQEVARGLKFAAAPETVALGKTQVSSFPLLGGVLENAIRLDGHRFPQPFVEVNPLFPIANLGARAMQDFAVTFDQRSGLVEFASENTVHLLPRPEPVGGTNKEELIGVVYVTHTYN